MASSSLDIVIIGLSITSSWGNGHATTYRGLVRELVRRGHRVLFLERDVPWYAAARDLPCPPYGQTALYRCLDELKDRFGGQLRRADAVIVGSYVPEGAAVGQHVTRAADGVTAFYDIDTPVTLAKLRRGDYEYITPQLIPRYHLYLSFTGGPLLRHIEHTYRSPRARPLYCSVDPELYGPVAAEPRWLLGYLGTYSTDRQPGVEELLCRPAGRCPAARFVVAGPLYPPELLWPENVERIEHLPPPEHARFYSAQRFTLNVTRADMRRAGYSPSVRLFEAAACATPVLSDTWDGLETFFAIGCEILTARSAAEAWEVLSGTPEQERLAIGARARARVLRAHTAAHRAAQLESYLRQLLDRRARGSAPPRRPTAERRV